MCEFEGAFTWIDSQLDVSEWRWMVLGLILHYGYPGYSMSDVRILDRGIEFLKSSLITV